MTASQDSWSRGRRETNDGHVRALSQSSAPQVSATTGKSQVEMWQLTWGTGSSYCNSLCRLEAAGVTWFDNHDRRTLQQVYRSGREPRMNRTDDEKAMTVQMDCLRMVSVSPRSSPVPKLALTADICKFVRGLFLADPRFSLWILLNAVL